MNTLPGIRGSVTPAGAQGSFGQGVNFVNIGNLGSNRTLTLINGRRFVTSNPNTLFGQGSAGTQVDVNTIQSILLDHTEITSIKGATVYGSDAIGGTVNYILRDRFNGLELNGLSGVTEQGDGFRYNAAVLAGHDYFGGRANITVAYTHDEQRGILANDRGYLRENVGSAGNPCTFPGGGTAANPCPAGNFIGNLGRPGNGITAANDGRINPAYGYNNSSSDGNPGTIAYRDLSIYYLNRNGVLTDAFRLASGAASSRVGSAIQSYQFDTQGNLVPFNTGVILPSIYASGGDGFRFNDYSQLTSDVKRDTANVFLHYVVSDALRFFAEGTYFHSYGNELVQQPSFNSNLFGGSSGPLNFLTSNPFLTAQARAQFAAQGITRFQVSRANDDLADLTGYSSTDIGRGVIGARGDFKIGNRNFSYEVYANYGRTHIDDVGQDINRQNFINAVNVTTNAAGQIVCTATPALQAAPGGVAIADPNCVPLNLFGAGQSSAAARAYIIQQTNTISVLQQKDFVARMQGSPFSLFGNDYSFALGYEHREEDGKFTPSAFQQQGLGRSAAIAATQGKYNVDEVFGEVLLPIVSPTNNVPFIYSLSFDGSARYVDNTVNGGFLAWSAGGEWSPGRDLQIRGVYTKSFRGPAITELFLPQSPQFAFVTDICSPANRNSGPVPATRSANCAAFLTAFPNATPLDAAAASVPALSGGNPNLDNEVSRSFTVGFTYKPSYIRGLSVSADYIDVRIANPIANLTVAQIVSGCFDNSSFNAADPANGNNFCSQIRRYTAADGGTAVNGGSRAGQVVNDPTNPGVRSGYVNGNRIFYAGAQWNVSYNTSLAGLGLPGSFASSTTFYYVNRRLIDLTGVGAVRTDGIVGDPKFQFQSTNRYLGDGWGISGTANYTGKQIATRNALSPDLREFNRFNPYVTVDGSIWFDAGERFRMTLAVINIGNKQYQNYLGYLNTGLGSIDSLGRRFSASVRLKY